MGVVNRVEGQVGSSDGHMLRSVQSKLRPSHGIPSHGTSFKDGFQMLESRYRPPHILLHIRIMYKIETEK